MEAESRIKSRAVDPDGGLDSTGGHDPVAARSQLVETITRHGHEYDFFQLTRLLSHIIERSESSNPPHEAGAIRFEPSPSVVFPATDVKRVEWTGRENDPIRVIVSFMGLYGFGSPLPSHYSRSIELEQKSSLPLKSFLDVFNHRIYSFFFRAWAKYRPWLAVGDEEASAERTRVVALAGLASEGAGRGQSGVTAHVGAFAGQLGGVVRNADGLRNMLHAAFPAVKVRIQENVPRWVWLSNRGRLGGSGASERPALGRTATIGEKIKDLSGKFRVVLGPLGLDRFESCLPGHDSAALIQSIVDHYVTDFLEYDVKLDLISAEVPPMILGERRRRLGLNTWLGKPSTNHTSRLVHYGTAA